MNDRLAAKRRSAEGPFARVLRQAGVGQKQTIVAAAETGDSRFSYVKISDRTAHNGVHEVGHQTVVYGSVEVFQSMDVPGADARTEEALMRLPEVDDWPFLTRSMFSVTPPGYGPHGSYLYRVISFGASYKAVEWEWAEWLLKFERLLAMLDFTYARVHLETELVGNHTYRWNGHSNDHKKISPAHWQFSGGPRTFSD